MYNLRVIDRHEIRDVLPDGPETDELIEELDAFIDKRISYGDADFTLVETTQIPALVEAGLAQTELYYAIYG